VLYGAAIAVRLRPVLVRGAVASRRRRLLRSLAAALSLAAVGLVAFIGLPEYIHFDCLD
jgi:hypothetical protein